MQRKPVLEQLERYLAIYPEDRVRVDHVQHFVRAHPDCFERSCPEGHVTGSAWIVSADRSRFLLGHHRKFDRWLQLGGHADGEPDPLRVALREAREESGLERFELVKTGYTMLPLDVDVHLVPELDGEPAHLHHDIRYLLLASRGESIRASDESHDVRWFPAEEADRVLTDPGLRRMARRAWRLLRN